MWLHSVDLCPGPNRFGFRPVARCLVDIPIAAEAAAAWPETHRALAALVAGIATAGRTGLPPPPAAGPLAERLRDAALYLQAASGHRVSFGTARAAPGEAAPGCRRAEVVFEVAMPEAARPTAEAACALLRAALPAPLGEEDGGTSPAWPDAYDAFRAVATLDSPLTVALEMIAVAGRLGMPVRRLATSRVIQVGWGTHAAFLANGLTSRTSDVAARLAGNKSTAAALLADHGLPTSSPHRLVRSAEQAVAAAEAVGYPVVVKPQRGKKGQGISANLTTAAQVRAAFPLAARHGTVMVERFLPGTDHRLLVINGAVAAAVERRPAQVTGDGVHTVADLVALTNAREERDGSLLNPLTLDPVVDDVLAAQGLDRTSVPAAGQAVLLRSTANFSTAGTTCDVTDRLHPEVRAMAVRAAAVLGLDVAGVDYITPDASRSPAATGGGITEVNIGPGLRLHFNPTHGRRRDVVAAALRDLVPAATAGRLPVTVITGRSGKQATARLLGQLLSLAGRCPGVYRKRTAQLGGRTVADGVDDAARAARILLDDPRCDAAVLELAPAELAGAGLPVDRCAVAVLLDHATAPPAEPSPGSGEPPEDTSTTTAARLSQGRAAVAVATRNATLGVIVNADDPRLLEVVAALPAPPLTLVSLAGPEAPPIAAHRAAGRRVAVLEPSPTGDRLLLLEGQRVWLRLPAAQAVPPGLTGKARARYLRTLLAALAAAHAQGVPSATLAAALPAVRALGETASLGPLRLRPLATTKETAEEMAPATVVLLPPPDPRRAEAVAALLPAGGRLLLAMPSESGTGKTREGLDLLRARADLVASPPAAAATGAAPADLDLALAPAPAGTWTPPPGHAPVEALAARCRAGDLLVVIDPDLDAAWKRLAPLTAPPPQRAGSLPPGVPWRGVAVEAACAARRVAGAWVSGGPLGWRAGGVAWGAADVRPGDLAILPAEEAGGPALSAAEATVMEAVRRGAVAVIAALVPRDLPRAVPLFLTDHPAAALEALADAAREAFPGPVVAVEAAAAALLPDLATALEATGPLARAYRPAPDGLGAALTLAGLACQAGTDGPPTALLYALPADGGAAAADRLLLRPGVTISAGMTGAEALAALAGLLPRPPMVAAADEPTPPAQPTPPT